MPTAADCELSGEALQKRLDECPVYTIAAQDRQRKRLVQASGASTRARTRGALTRQLGAGARVRRGGS